MTTTVNKDKTMSRHQRVNEALHQRIDEGVKEGRIEVPSNHDMPQSLSVAQLVDNLQQGRPLLDGVRVYRGAKDPDVDAGTFGAQTKHATPVLAVARGYAEFSNEHIGLRCPATRGIGMLAEYALPDEAVFHRNFGLEAQDGSDNARPGVTRREAEAQLQPLVQAYAAAPDPVARDAARQAVEAYVQRELYELALPATSEPLHQFVVQADDTGRSRLLVHQDVGPLADVIVDVIRERKAAVDEYHARKLLDGLTRADRSGVERLDALQPGLSRVYGEVAQRVTALTTGLRTAAAAMPLTTVGEAIAWRTRAQHGIHMAQLTNSGIVIEHKDPSLQRIAALRPALDTIENGVAAARWLGERQPVVRQLRKVAHAAEMHAAAQTYVATTQEALDRATTEQQKWQGARDRAAAQYRQLHSAHGRQLRRNFILRLWYGLRQQARVEVNLQQRAGALAQLNARLQHATIAVERAGEHSDTAAGGRRASAEVLELLQSSVRALRKEGALDFLGDVARRQLDRRAMTAQDWAGLAAVAEEGLQPLVTSVMEAQAAGRQLEAIALHGLQAELPADPEADADVVPQAEPAKADIPLVMATAITPRPARAQVSSVGLEMA
ncbi:MULTISPECIES: hypothetical protein [Cupriavidus]